MSKVYVMPDAHFGELKRPVNQTRAINAFFKEATEEDADVLSIGDYAELEAVANIGMVRREFSKVLGSMQEYQTITKKPIHVVRGNHDRNLTNELLEEELTPGIRHHVHNTLFLNERDGIVAHHGDLVDIKSGSLEQFLSQYNGHDTKALLEFFEEKEAAEMSEYAKSRQEYHARNMIFVWDIMRILQKAGLSLEVQLKVFDWLFSPSFKNKVQASIDAKKVLPNAPADFRFNTWLLNQTTAWAVVQGHTHIPSHTRWADRESTRAGIIANAGSIYSTARVPTAIILDASKRESTMLAYRNDAWRKEDVMTLNEPNRVFLPNK
jgi:predicted phosphodiesterase